MALVQLGDERLTVAATAVGFASIPAAPQAVQLALCRVETASIRCTSGGTPVADGSDGSMRKDIDEEFEVWGDTDIRNFKAIRETSTSAALSILYFGAKS